MVPEQKKAGHRQQPEHCGSVPGFIDRPEEPIRGKVHRPESDIRPQAQHCLRQDERTGEGYRGLEKEVLRS